jgi:hypothetical protein
MSARRASNMPAMLGAAEVMMVRKVMCRSTGRGRARRSKIQDQDQERVRGQRGAWWRMACGVALKKEAQNSLFFKYCNKYQRIKDEV